MFRCNGSEWRFEMLAIGIILIIAAVFLTIAVLMQHGKSHNLSGTIAGASETFFGKSKATTIDRKLSVLTSVVAVVFVVLVLVAYLMQGATTGKSGAAGQNLNPGSEVAAESESESESESASESVSGTESGTDAPATDAPATDAPATDAPATDAPATDAPATDAPVVE